MRTAGLSRFLRDAAEKAGTIRSMDGGPGEPAESGVIVSGQALIFWIDKPRVSNDRGSPIGASHLTDLLQRAQMHFSQGSHINMDTRYFHQAQTLIIIAGMLIGPVSLFGQSPEAAGRLAGATAVDLRSVHKTLLQDARGSETSQLLRPLFGSETGEAIAVLDEDETDILAEVNSATLAESETVDQEEIEKIRNSLYDPKPAASLPAVKPVPQSGSRKMSYTFEPTVDWRRLVFGFQAVPTFPDDDIKTSKSAGEIKSEGERSKTFETDKAILTKNQKAETRLIKDGKSFGIVVKTTETVDGRSKTDDSTFHKVTEIMWKASVAACPDVNGITAGTGEGKLKTETEVKGASGTARMTRTVNVSSKTVGNVNDNAEMTDYDLMAEAVETISGYDDAARRGLMTEPVLKDRTTKLFYELTNNQIERKPTDGIERTPAKLGKLTVKKMSGTSDEEVKAADKPAGALVAGIWNHTNSMYSSARSFWRSYRCVSIDAKAPKTRLKKGETITMTAETVHRQDGSKVNARLEAGALDATVAPEIQTGTPRVTYRYTNGDEKISHYTVESFSKRGIGIGGVAFVTETECSGGYTRKIEINKKKVETNTKVTSKGQHVSDQHYSGTDTYKFTFEYSAAAEITDSDLRRSEDGSVSVELRGVAAANASRIADEKSQWTTTTDCFPDPTRQAGKNSSSLMEEIGSFTAEPVDGVLQINGRNFRISIAIPEIVGTSTQRTVVKPFGWCMMEQNPSSDETEKSEMSFSQEAVEIEGTIDPSLADAIEGSRTFEDEMGFQVTVRWSLKKCR